MIDMIRWDEFYKGLQWLPPYTKNVVEVKRFMDISKGRLVIVEITDYPQDFCKLIEWIEYRKEIGKPLIVFRTYLTKAKDHVIGIKMHEDDYPVFISIHDFSVYVKRTAFNKSHRIRTTLRYVLYYSGYKLKYRYTNVSANRYIKTKQITLPL